MNGEKIKPSYYSVVPAEVRYCKALGNASPRDLYGEVSALCNKHGYCFASNKYFGDLYEVDPRTIRRWLCLLEKEGFIYTKVVGKKRKIYLVVKQPDVDDIEEPVPETADNEQQKMKPAKKVCNFTEKDLYLANLLYSKILSNFPVYENKKINIQEWAVDIRKLREIDKATGDQIEYMINWIHGGTITKNGNRTQVLAPHDFWSKNILSASKLRKQWFNNLVPQLQDTFKKTVKKHSTVQL